ncbi:MAG: hypothetical protein HZY78_04540 [Burkholderiaceae bacterium]|nr:MAG: hypothetical protein HZY78_04540 [Burkholderiaceae bacterium]
MTARLCLQAFVFKEFSVLADVHLLGECAAWPIEPPSGVQAALQILAMAPAIAAVCALPAHPMTARSTMLNCRI